MKTDSRPGWKRLLQEAQELQGQAGKVAFRRATILSTLFDDAEFRADLGASDDFGVAMFLDTLIEDLCLGFFDLRAMLREFPEVAAWEPGKLLTLYEQTCQRIESRKPEREERPSRAVKRITKDEFAAERRQKEEAVARNTFLERRVEEVQKSYAELVQENRGLRDENAHLRGRIAELERIVRKELVAA